MIRSSLLFATLIFLGASCQDDELPGNACNSDFDQTILFAAVADNLILPGYETLADDLEELRLAHLDFVADPTPATLTPLREKFESSWITWQSVEQFNFGPAEEFTLRQRFNPFPLNVDETEARIAAENLDFSNPDASFTQGFPALDYLLYGTGDTYDAIIVTLEEPSYRAFLADQISDLASTSAIVRNKWRDGYRDQFVNNTGTAAGSSLSLMVNNLNQNYEILKRDRLGIPSGVLTIGIPNPDRVEAPHSGISLELARASLRATYAFYLSHDPSSEPEITGLDDYLIAIDARKNDQSLDALIRAQFDVAVSTLNALDGRLQDLAADETSRVVDAYNEVTKNLVNLKTDLPSVLCVSITYVDNPSDSD